MAKARGNDKRNNGIVKVVVEKVQRSLSLSKKKSRCVPEDVKEGYFAVIAEDKKDSKRLLVPLSCLSHPCFLRLLEEAAEEYGFDHEGALTIPCRPSELERILAAERSLEYLF